ncbi:hypothetical protein P9D14_12905 [Bacillus velezensis]|uniref:hypothetical protein n=1 Tax=Bacillus velezensis TaxID=492670 RepID=UPI002DBF01DE|nr:hypothetical protein [Bacillus velezensis]MEC1384416.1 hypothetical protein [Bacillus velezensis]
MIKLQVIITSKYVDRDTITQMNDKGWTFVTTLPAKSVHPYGTDTDKATIFSRYETADLMIESTAKEDE